MKAYRIIFLTLFLVSTASVVNAQAQSNGAIMSLYSQYGLGELSTQGTAASKGMGGIGIASRDMTSINFLNPASYTTLQFHSVMFSVSGEGVNNYLKTKDASNSKNYFNLGHLGLQFGLSNKLGLGIVIAPYSSMGYELSVTSRNPDIVENIGNVRGDYSGSGGIAQFKVGLAYRPFKNFSIGANYIYYLGSFNQNYNRSITQYLIHTSIANLYDSKNAEINQSSFEIGAQYTIKVGTAKNINIGVTFQPKMESNISVIHQVITNSGDSQSNISEVNIIKDEKYDDKYSFPMKLGSGISYATTKLHTELNYVYQDWKNSFPINGDNGGYFAVNGIGYSDRHEIRAGIAYTPNRFDIRSAMKRWTYRAGVAYGNSYVVKNGYRGDEISASIGLGVPIEKRWFSAFNVGVEAGQSGTVMDGQVRNRFIKLNLGFSFSVNNWFIRHKYK